MLQFAVEPDRRGAVGGGVESEHQGGGEGPGLRSDIADRIHAHTRFLVDLAGDRILQALARFDEAGQRGIASRRPARLPAQQGPIAVAHQHDDGRIDARKEFRAAFAAGALEAVPRAARSSRSTADPAMPVPGAPHQQCAGTGQDGRLGLGQFREQGAQLGQLGIGGKARGIRERINQYAARATEPSQQHQLLRFARSHQRVRTVQEGNAGLRVPSHQVLGAAGHQESRLRFGTRLLHPPGLGARFRTPLQRGPAKGVIGALRRHRAAVGMPRS